MPRSENETMLIGELYINRQRDGTAQKVATVEGGAAEIEIAAYPAGSMAAGDLQSVLEALAARIEALEP